MRLDRPRVVEMTWVSEATQGKESIVIVVTIEPHAGGRANVQLTHANLPDDALGRSHQEGWKEILETLAKRLVQRKSG